MVSCNPLKVAQTTDNSGKTRHGKPHINCVQLLDLPTLLWYMYDTNNIKY